MSSLALSLSGVIKRFDGHLAVNGVSFEVPEGVVFGILGPNGAGKSTTLRMINNIIVPDAGEIRILGGLPPGEQAARQVGYLPEERGLYPRMRVLDMVMFVGELRGLSRHDARQRARRWIDRLGLGDWSAKRVQELSKGMAQKVQFATALIHDPALVILDEPWSGLDPINAEVLREVVEEVRAAGRTVLFSTHQMEQAERLCDSVCIIARGEKVLDGRLKDLKLASAADGVIALGFVDEPARARAASLLSGSALVAERRPPRPGEHADFEVALAAGVTSRELLATLLDHDLVPRMFEVVTPTLHQIFVAKVGANAAVASRRPDQEVVGA